jgi:rhamnulokinase
MAKRTVVAVDLGAESGRVMAVHFDGRSLQVTPIHRFANHHTTLLKGTLHWDILALWREIQQGIEKVKPLQPASIGVDAWGVDFGLLDRQGNLIGNLVQYRDSRTKGMMEKVFTHINKEAIFNQTGIQFSRINTLYQLMSLVESQSPQLDIAHTFLTVPDLFHYLLSGTAVCEFSIASTTQIVNPHTKTWGTDILSKLGIPTHIFPEIVLPGTRLGTYTGIPVITPGSHDTASAVAGIPTTTPNYAYISSGTWSLVGIEVQQPIINEATLAANLTNEGGVYGTIRLLKNVMGLWLLQQCRHKWNESGMSFDYDELEALALNTVPFASLVNPNDPLFLPPGTHEEHIRRICLKTNQSPPQTVGAVVRCILESLALTYHDIIQKLIYVSGQPVHTIHIVGGGSKNGLLNQMTANATGIPVIAGPVEASVLGNAIVQLITLGDLKDLQEARQLIAETQHLHLYEPEETAVWAEAYHRFKDIVA